jgi:hypothetical protein
VYFVEMSQLQLQQLWNEIPSSDDGENEEPKREVQLYTAV